MRRHELAANDDGDKSSEQIEEDNSDEGRPQM